MADITKCPGKYCKVKEACYRYTAVSSEYMQSYFFDLPIDKDGECDHFWDNEIFKCSKNGVKKYGESCTMNNNCAWPECLIK
jgi:hypothetical protein